MFFSPPPPLPPDPPALVQFNSSKQQCKDYIAINLAYRRHIETISFLEPHRWQEYDAADREARDLYRAWDLLGDAYTCERSRANYLKRLREYIGERNFWYGIMPAPVPLHLFSER